MINNNTTNNNKPFVKGSYFEQLRDLCSRARIKMISNIVDISKPAFDRVSADHEFSMYTFDIYSNQFDTCKWWDGHKLVTMPKTFIGLCRRLKSIIESETRNFVSIKNATYRRTPSSTSSEETLHSVTDYADSNDGFSSNEQTPPCFDFVLTTTLKVQLVTYLIGGHLAFGMCCQCKQPVYFKDTENEENGTYEAGCLCPMFSIYMCPAQINQKQMTIKQLTELVGDLLATFAYDDCIICVPSNLQFKVQRKYKDRLPKTADRLMQFLFVDSSYEFNESPNKILCQLVLHRRSH